MTLLILKMGKSTLYNDKADIFHQNRYVIFTARDESGNVIATV